MDWDHGARRAWTVSMISALSIPCRYTAVMPRLVWPIWRWIPGRGTPSHQLEGVGVAQLMGREASPRASPPAGPLTARFAELPPRGWEAVVREHG